MSDKFQIYFSSPPTSRNKSADQNLLAALGSLMEEHPTALLSTSMLPASKSEIKKEIKRTWIHRLDARPNLGAAYLFLSAFQDGIDGMIIEYQSPEAAIPPYDLEALRREANSMKGPKGDGFRKWLMWSKVSMAEMEILEQEWRTFTERNP